MTFGDIIGDDGRKRIEIQLLQTGFLALPGHSQTPSLDAVLLFRRVDVRLAVANSFSSSFVTSSLFLINLEVDVTAVLFQSFLVR